MVITKEESKIEDTMNALDRHEGYIYKAVPYPRYSERQLLFISIKPGKELVRVDKDPKKGQFTVDKYNGFRFSSEDNGREIMFPDKRHYSSTVGKYEPRGI